MIRKCPDCGKGYLARTNTLILCPECSYREIPLDMDKNWLSTLSKDAKLWDRQVTKFLPFPLVTQYEEIQAMAAQESAYKTLHALHELIRMMIRFPVLCAAVVMEDKGIDGLLTEKELSLETWVQIARAEIGIPAGKSSNPLPAPLSNLLTQTVRLFQEHELDKSRPDFFAVSSRLFVASKELISFVKKTVHAMARFFMDIRPSLKEIEFAVHKQQGVNGKVQENIILTVNEFKGTLHPYILFRQEELFFFDGMSRDRKRAVYRNFGTGVLHERAVAHFSEATQRDRDVFAPFQAKDLVPVAEVESRLVEQSAYHDYVPSIEFEQWLRTSLRDRGVFLFQSPALSGKSVLCNALSKEAPVGKSIRLDGVETIVYRCTSKTAGSAGAFIAGLYYAMTGRSVSEYAEDEITSVLLNQPPLSLDGPGSMAAILNEYRRTCKQRLLVVIDGLDKIPADAGTVFDCLPGREELDEGVFLLLACREPNPREENEAFLRFLERPFDATHIVLRNSNTYEAMVHRYIEARVRIRVGRKWRMLTDEEILQLMQVSGCCLSDIKLYAVLLSEGVPVDSLPLRPKLFGAYISTIREKMGRRHFRPTIRMLSAIASAVEPLTITELCGLFEYDGIPRQVLTQMEEIAPFLHVTLEKNDVRLSLADPTLVESVLGIFPEMIGDVVGHVAMRVLDATDEELVNPGNLALYCFSSITEYIRIYGNKNMLDVLCKYKIYYKMIQMSKLLFSDSVIDIFRRESLLTSALILLRHSEGRDVLRATTFNARGNFYTSLCRYREAREDYTSSIQLGEKCSREFQMTNENILAGTYINRGAIHRVLGQLDDAIADFSRAIDLRKRLFRSRQLTDEKELAVVYHYCAQALVDKKQYGQAVENYSHALEIWERLYQNGYYTDAYNLASAYHTRAMLLNLEGRSLEEVMDYSRAIEVLGSRKRLSLPENELLHTLYLRRAEVHELLGNTETAREDRAKIQNLE